MKKIKGIIFDLDGTLADTAEDIAAAVNHTLKTYRLPAMPTPEVFRHVNHGVQGLIDGCFPAELISSEEKYNEILSVYRTFYFENIAVHTALYPGIGETLAELNRRGVKLAVLSNKADILVKKLTAQILPEIPFVEVLGASEAFPLKPDPAAALYAAEKMGLAPAETAFCGDSDVDVLTAKNAGFYALSVLWGNCTREKLTAAGADFLAGKAEDILTAAEGAEK